MCSRQWYHYSQADGQEDALKLPQHKRGTLDSGRRAAIPQFLGFFLGLPGLSLK